MNKLDQALVSLGIVFAQEKKKFLASLEKLGLPDKAISTGQRRLQKKHGTPLKFAHVCAEALGEVSVDEANDAIEKYRREWLAAK